MSNSKATTTVSLALTGTVNGMAMFSSRYRYSLSTPSVSTGPTICSASVPGAGKLPERKISIPAWMVSPLVPVAERQNTCTARKFPLHGDVSHDAAFSPAPNPPTMTADENPVSESFFTVTSAACAEVLKTTASAVAAKRIFMRLSMSGTARLQP